MNPIEHFESYKKPNYVVVYGVGDYLVTEINKERMVLIRLDATPTGAPFIDRWFKIGTPGIFGVYGTSMENITVELIK